MKNGNPKGPALPCLQASFQSWKRSGTISMGFWQETDGTLRLPLIRGEFNKGTIYRGAGRGGDHSPEVFWSRNSAQVPPGPQG